MGRGFEPHRAHSFSEEWKTPGVLSAGSRGFFVASAPENSSEVLANRRVMTRISGLECDTGHLATYTELVSVRPPGFPGLGKCCPAPSGALRESPQQIGNRPCQLVEPPAVRVMASFPADRRFSGTG